MVTVTQKDSDAFQQLQSGKVVAYATDSPVAGYYTAQHGDQFQVAGQVIEPIPEGIVVALRPRRLHQCPPDRSRHGRRDRPQEHDGRWHLPENPDQVEPGELRSQVSRPVRLKDLIAKDDPSQRSEDRKRPQRSPPVVLARLKFHQYRQQNGLAGCKCIRPAHCTISRERETSMYHFDWAVFWKYLWPVPHFRIR